MSWLSQGLKAIGGAASKVAAVTQGLAKVPFVGSVLSPVLAPIGTAASTVGLLAGRAQQVGTQLRAATTLPSIHTQQPNVHHAPTQLSLVRTVPPTLGASMSLSSADATIHAAAREAYGRDALPNELAYHRANPSVARGAFLENAAGMGLAPPLATRAFDAVAGGLHSLFGGRPPLPGGVQVGTSLTPSIPHPVIGQGVQTGVGLPAGVEIYRGRFYARGRSGRRIRVTINKWGLIVPAPKRMDVLNPRALSRAGRRMDGFRNVAAGALRRYGFTVGRTQRATKGKKKRARR